MDKYKEEGDGGKKSEEMRKTDEGEKMEHKISHLLSHREWETDSKIYRRCILKSSWGFMKVE